MERLSDELFEEIKKNLCLPMPPSLHRIALANNVGKYKVGTFWCSDCFYELHIMTEIPHDMEDADCDGNPVFQCPNNHADA